MDSKRLLKVNPLSGVLFKGAGALALMGPGSFKSKIFNSKGVPLV